MSRAYDDALPLEEHVLIALEELSEASGLSAEEIVDLVEHGAFEPAGGGGASAGDVRSWRFTARYIITGRRASRLRQDFELSTPGLALVLSFLDRIEELERQVRTLEAQLLRD